MSFVRTRWSALGAAVAVALGGGGIAMVSATSPADAVTFVPITPCRVMDTRPALDNVGPRSAPLGTDDTYTVDAIAADDAAGDCAGIIPTSATAISMNVTTTDATAGTFLTIWEADVAPRPTASSLNPQPGQAATPNAVTTSLNPDGEFSIYNLAGTVNVLADINGYYTDHHHDDRYYTQSQADQRFQPIAAAPTAAFESDSGDDTIGFADEAVVAVTVATPGLGSVIVNASGTLWNATADDMFVSCSISESDSVDFAAQLSTILDQSDRRVVSGTRGFEIDRAAASAGEQTYRFVCDTTSVAETFGIIDPHITAVFFAD